MMNVALLEMLIASFARSAGASLDASFSIASVLVEQHGFTAETPLPSPLQCRKLAEEATFYGMHATL
jgi:hypothetical protein